MDISPQISVFCRTITSGTSYFLILLNFNVYYDLRLFKTVLYAIHNHFINNLVNNYNQICAFVCYLFKKKKKQFGQIFLQIIKMLIILSKRNHSLNSPSRKRKFSSKG